MLKEKTNTQESGQILGFFNTIALHACLSLRPKHRGEPQQTGLYAHFKKSNPLNLISLYIKLDT